MSMSPSTSATMPVRMSSRVSQTASKLLRRAVEGWDLPLVAEQAGEAVEAVEAEEVEADEAEGEEGRAEEGHRH